MALHLPLHCVPHRAAVWMHSVGVKDSCKPRRLRLMRVCFTWRHGKGHIVFLLLLCPLLLSHRFMFCLWVWEGSVTEAMAHSRLGASPGEHELSCAYQVLLIYG